MAKRSPAKQAELKVNYARLREAGYSPADAARLRSSSNTTITQALHTEPLAFRQARPISERHAKAATGLGTRYKKKDTYQQAHQHEYSVHKGQIRERNFITMEEAERNYDNDVAVLTTYIVVDKYGVETRKYFTLLPDTKEFIDIEKGIKLNPKNIKNFVYENCAEQGKETQYEAKIKKSTIEIIGLYSRD